MKHLALIRTNEEDFSIGIGDTEADAAEKAFHACTEALGLEMATFRCRNGIWVMPMTDGMVNFDISKAVAVRIEIPSVPAP